jgi:hypothetical protein
MPWSASDAKTHKKGLTSTQATAWAKIANSALAECQKKGDSDCEGRAIRTANAAVERVGKVAKLDTELGLSLGWASVVMKDNTLVEDRQGDVIEPQELEPAVFDFMKHHRATNEMHAGDEYPDTIVESVVVSPEKLELMFAKFWPDELLEQAKKHTPTGWWIGSQIDPTSETFQRVKSGELSMFSIEGAAERVEVA